jgi:hypothetical protein
MGKTIDLLAAPDQLYQIDRRGNVTRTAEHVTSAELTAFMESHPQEYTVEALLAFVRGMRAASPR